jgi:L-lactate dehydrogenase complex protein LldG
VSGSREQILGNIRHALRRTEPLDGSTRSALESRMSSGVSHARPPLPHDLESRFITKVDAAAAGVEHLPGVSDVSRAVMDYLDREGLGREIVTGSDDLLNGIHWSNELAVSRRAAQDSDRVSVTTAFVGIAETGSVMLLSDPSSPTTLNFLPEHHIVLLDRTRIVGHLEDAFATLRRERTAMPRSVNIITGPSRTGDVELNMEFGAHGPRRLYVMLLETP